MLAQLLGHQVVLGNFDLFFSGIARDLNEFHSVAQGGLNSAQVIGGCDKKNLRQVVAHLEKMVVKTVVLFGVKNLEQRARRISLRTHTQLVDLVKNQDRVGDPCLLNLLKDAARHGSNVGLAVPANLCLVAHSSKRHAHVGTPQCFGHGAAQRGLTHPRRSVEAKNRAFEVALERQHGKVL